MASSIAGNDSETALFQRNSRISNAAYGRTPMDRERGGVNQSPCDLGVLGERTSFPRKAAKTAKEGLDNTIIPRLPPAK